MAYVVVVERIEGPHLPAGRWEADIHGPDTHRASLRAPDANGAEIYAMCGGGEGEARAGLENVVAFHDEFDWEKRAAAARWRKGMS